MVLGAHHDRVPDGRGPTLRDRPAVRVGCCGQRHADRGRQQPVEGAERVRRDAGEQRLRLLCAPPTDQLCRRKRCVGAEPGQRQRMARHVRHGSEDLGADGLEPLGERAEQRRPRPPVGPEARRRLRDRTPQHRTASSVEWVRQLGKRPSPRQTRPRQVEPSRELGGHGERMERGTVVVDQPWEGELARPRATAEGVRRLDDPDSDAAGRKRQRGSEPVRSASYHHRVRQRAAS